LRTVDGMKLAVCFAVTVTAVGALVPTPIGAGQRYRPPAHSGANFACAQAPLRAGARVHLELFANRRVVIVPAGIGLRRAHSDLGRVVAAACRARAWTLDPSGVVRYAQPATLGAVFAVWGQPLGPNRLASFRGPVSTWVNGIRRRSDPRALPLRDGDEIVLEIRGHVPPHASFRFPP
jgi:hypothetical protein